MRSALPLVLMGSVAAQADVSPELRVVQALACVVRSEIELRDNPWLGTPGNLQLVPELLEYVGGRDEQNAERAAILLTAVRGELRGTPARPLDEVSWRALFALSLAEPDRMSKAAVPLLREALRDGDARARLFACAAIVRIAPDEPELVPALARILREDELGRRRCAALLLADLGARARGATAELVSCLERETLDVPEAMLALAPFAGELPAVVPLCVRVLRSDRPLARHHALLALARIGPAAKAAAPEILAWLFDAPHVVRTREGVCAEAKALASIDAPLATLRILRALRDPFRAPDAARVLEQMGELSASVVLRLAAALREETDEGVCEQIAGALGGAGARAVLAVPQLVRLLEQRPSLAAMQALARIGPTANPALPAVRRWLESDDPAVREAAEQALRAIR